MMYNVNWRVIASLPVSVSGSFCGVSNGMLIVAGGSNFPDAKPWQGGKKKYWNKIYVIDIKNNYQLIPVQDTLEKNVAYGACVSTAQGVLCLGGENENGILNDVFLLHWDLKTQKIEKEKLPSLPIALTSSSACSVQSKIFLIGGDNGKESTNSFFQLDINAVNKGWTQLPALPASLSFPISAANVHAEASNIIVIGGREKMENALTKLYNTVYTYNTSLKKWEKKKNICHTDSDSSHLSAGNIVSLNNENIIIIGGDDGKTFSKIEKFNMLIGQETNESKKAELVAQKMELINNHKGFSKKVFLYNIHTQQCLPLSDLPFSPVTTNAVKWNDEIFIAGGEIKPGERTNLVLCGKITRKH
ncbi:MAG: hypothetical protein JSR09_10210 [Bacteroidetes bacterium]|nr:hypothetical protein [Bacteroidota bacterium]MBS1650063.1 hypothetical protein [Bacteroidota bacterium]